MVVPASVFAAAGAAASSSPDGWGWDPASFSAVATVVAAVGTVGTLGYILWNQRKDAETAKAAQRSADAAQRSAEAAQEEAAGAWRPLVTPGNASVAYIDGTQYAEWERVGTTIQVEFQNVGRGPAISLRAQLNGSHHGVLVREADGTVVESIGILHTDDMRSFGGLAHDGEPDASYVLQLDYADLGGREYSTVVTYAKAAVRSSSIGRKTFTVVPDDFQIMKGRRTLASDA